MICGICKSDEHRVIETTDRGDRIRRRRKCEQCGNRWTTFEVSEDAVTAGVAAAREHLRALEAVLIPKG